MASIGRGMAAALMLVLVSTPAFLLLRTTQAASDHFDRAAISQAQLADALMIHAAIAAGDGVRLRSALALYRADIAAETRLLGEAARSAQDEEEAEVAAMAAMVRADPPRRAALARLADAAAARERREVQAIANAMGRLRARTRWYALLLAAIAILAAMIGATALVAANRRLTRAVDDRTRRLVAIDAARRLFFAKVSHELRTPVTVLRGEAEVALTTAASDPSALADALGEVVVQSEQLDRRIGELLALSRADDGQIAIEMLPVDLVALADRAVAAAARHARSNAVELVRRGAEAIVVRGDARWLEQAMVAAIDNAVKFSSAGATVELIVAQHGATGTIAVADRGIGMPATALPQIFDAYYQAPEGRARGGTGLGLALVRWVAERHGGTAAAAPREGGGCVVTVTLPIAGTA